MKEITWKLHLKSSKAETYHIINSDEGRAKFWAESAVEKEGFIHFDFINGMTYKSEILSQKINAEFSLEYFGTIVTFTFQDNEKNGCDLTMVNKNIPAEEYNDFHAGWLSVLFALKGAVDFNIDLRNHDTERTWDQLYIEN